MFYFTRYASPFGGLVLTGDGRHLAGLRFEGRADPGPEETAVVERNDLAPFLLAREWLDDYFAGKRPDMPRGLTAPDGSRFRRTVWRLLLEIPYGQTVTYGELARETARLLGKNAMSAQAVGGAAGHNPIPVFIPCHRVVGAHGEPVGYAYGLDIKIELLKFEARTCFSGVRPADAETGCV